MFFLDHSPPHILRQNLLLNLDLANVTRLAIYQSPKILFSLTVTLTHWDYGHTILHPDFYMGAGDPNPGSYA